jgi:hypothetical protein
LSSIWKSQSKIQTLRKKGKKEEEKVEEKPGRKSWK